MIPTTIPATPRRGGQHPICRPYRAIRETLTGRRIVECETCGAICIVGRPYEVRRRKGVYADTYI
jgi:hypothetical protein